MFRKKNSASRSRKTQVITEIEVEGIPVKITRKQVKNINMRVKGPNGHVEVSAPNWIGEDQIAKFVAAKTSWIRKKQATVASSLKTQAEHATEEELQAWKESVSQKVLELIAYWEPLMGVKAQKVAYRNMSSRWGSCNPQTGRICINIQLAQYPAECLEYVVVHELCHLLERGHGDRFRSLMTQFLPDWKSRRALLR